MHRFDPVRRFLAVLVAGAALLSGSACGGSEDDTVPPLSAAIFTAPASPAGSISMQPGPANGNQFTIRIVAKGLSNLFGTSFHVTFNSGVSAFVSADSSASILKGAGIQTQISAIGVSGHPNELAVVATRVQNAGGTVTGVTVAEGELVTLTFSALSPTAGTTFDFGLPREACDPTPRACGPVSPVPTWQGGVLTVN